MCWSWARTGQPDYYNPSGYTTNGDGTHSLGTWSSTGPWTTAAPLPQVGGAQFVAEDDPAAVLPNGKVLMALSAEGYNSPTYLYEFDPSANPGTTNPYTRLDSSDPMLFPPGLYSELEGISAFQVRMLVLPTGEVAMSFINNTEMWTVSDSSGSPASVPTLYGPPTNTNSIYSLTGTGLTGLSEGAYYGDDGEMSTNFPIVKFDNGGSVWFAKVIGWTPSVATGATSTVYFTLPPDLPAMGYDVTVVASGVESSSVSFSYGGPFTVDTSFNSSTPGFMMTTFNTVTDAINAASGGQVIIVDGSNGSTGSGVYGEDVHC